MGGGGTVGNVVGQGLGDLLLVLTALRAPQALPGLLVERARAGADPVTRAGLAGRPFLSGLLGFGGMTRPAQDVVPGVSSPALLATAEAETGAPITQPTHLRSRFLPDLPALAPEVALQSEQAALTLDAVRAFRAGRATVAQKRLLGIPPTVGEVAAEAAAATGGQGAPRLRVSRIGPGGPSFDVVPENQDLVRTNVANVFRDPATGKLVKAAPARPAGGGTIDVDTLGRLFGPPSAPPATMSPAPAPRAARPLPPNVVPLEQVPLDAPAGTGFPPPAFDDAAPARSVAPGAGPRSRLGVLQQALPPGTRLTIGPGGVKSMSLAGPSVSQKGDFTVQAATKAVNVLRRAKVAIKRLRAKSILTDDPVMGSLGQNFVQLEFAARASGDPETRDDATFLLRNLQSAVPTLARGFGEQRTNVQEEQRIRDALSFKFVPAATAEAVLDNYIGLFESGGAPAVAAPGGVRVLGVRPAAGQ